MYSMLNRKPDTYHERCVMSESEKAQSKSMNDVDHACHSCILTKRHNSTPSIIYHTLIVYQSDTLKVHNFAQLIKNNPQTQTLRCLQQGKFPDIPPPQSTHRSSISYKGYCILNYQGWWGGGGGNQLNMLSKSLSYLRRKAAAFAYPISKPEMVHELSSGTRKFKLTSSDLRKQVKVTDDQSYAKVHQRHVQYLNPNSNSSSIIICKWKIQDGTI